MPDQPSNVFTVNREVRTAPDPSLLTTENILRETNWLEKLLRATIEGIEKTIIARLDAMDKALVLLQTRADRVPSEVDLKVGALERLNAETFSSIQKQFEGVDKLSNQAATSSKVAIDAALSAFDKSTAKAEASVDARLNLLATSTDKRFEQVDKQFNTAMGSRDVLIEAIRERTASIEAKISAMEGRGGGMQASWAILIGAVVLISTVIGVFMMILKG